MKKFCVSTFRTDYKDLKQADEAVKKTKTFFEGTDKVVSTQSAGTSTNNYYVYIRYYETDEEKVELFRQEVEELKKTLQVNEGRSSFIPYQELFS